MTAIVKRYFYAGREDGPKLLKKIRGQLIDLGLYRECAVFQKTGGRSGEMGAKTMEYEVYFRGSESGRTRGGVHLYSVVDDSCNGFAQLFSVLIDLPKDDCECFGAVVEFLDDLDFVAKHISKFFKTLGHG